MKIKDILLKTGIPALIAAIAIIALCVNSCDNSTLSKRLARKAIEKEAAFRDSSQVEPFSVGYYEIDSASLKTFARLKKEGVVDYKLDEVTERHKFERYTWWEGTKTYYKDIKHYFVKVSLTEEGKKYVVSNPPTKRLDEDSIPELTSWSENASDTIDFEGDEGPEADTAGATAVDAAAKTEKASAERGTQYSKAVAKVKFSTVNVLTGFNKVERVLDVFCPENYRKEGRGKCRFICVFKGVTPFGLALTSHKEGERMPGNAELVRYEDKGWQVNFYSMGIDE